MKPTHVHITEVGARDGLQNEAQTVPAAVKIELIARLHAAGQLRIEATSFVSPKWVPQMADAAEVMAGINAAKLPGAHYAVLTPNLKGLEGAVAAGADEVVVFAAASEAFSQKNTNCSIDEGFERMAPVVAAAHAAGLTVRGPISCALGCPYEGAVSAQQVGRIAQRYKALGVERIYVADTIGTGTPRHVQAAMEAVLAHYDVSQVAGHFHDTYGQALANTLASLELGVYQFDSAIAGLGGCPYAKGATGNVATEDLVYMLHGMGIDTGLDLPKLVAAGRYISDFLGRKPNSRVAVAMLNKAH